MLLKRRLRVGKTPQRCECEGGAAGRLRLRCRTTRDRSRRRASGRRRSQRGAFRLAELAQHGVDVLERLVHIAPRLHNTKRQQAVLQKGAKHVPLALRAPFRR